MVILCLSIFDAFIKCNNIWVRGEDGIFMGEYMGVFMLALGGVAIATIILGCSYLVGVWQPDIEKVSVYECGFDPFGTPRVPFSVKFFLVGILFLIFDLEISFIFPWCVSLGRVGLLGV